MTTFLKSSGSHRPYKIIIEICGFHFIITTCISTSTRHRRFVYYVRRGMSFKQSIFHSWPSAFPSLVESFNSKTRRTSKQRTVRDEGLTRISPHALPLLYRFYIPSSSHSFVSVIHQIQNTHFCRFLLLRALFRLKNSFQDFTNLSLEKLFSRP